MTLERERARDAVHDARVSVCSWAELLTEAHASGAPLDRLLARLAEAVAAEQAAVAARDALLLRR